MSARLPLEECTEYTFGRPFANDGFWGLNSCRIAGEQKSS